MRSLPLTDPGTPPLTTPLAFLLWQARRQWGILLAAIICGVLGNVANAFLPYVIGHIIDHGLSDGLSQALGSGCGALAGLAGLMIASFVVGHWLDVQNRLRASFASSQLIGHHVTRTGNAVTAELPTGEVIATVASDAFRLGDAYSIAPRFLGGVAAYVAITVVLLRASGPMGALAVVTLPVVAVSLALLARPLHHRQADQREVNGRLTALGADTVSGLRILRGIGGESVFADRYCAQSQKVRAAGVRVAQTQSLLDAVQTLLPGAFIAAVVWLGARLALAGAITPGQLVAFYGFAAFLVQPILTATESMRVASRAYIGAGRIIQVLLIPETSATDKSVALPPPPQSDLVDPASGLVVRAGTFVALVSADPDSTARIAARLGRFDDGSDVAAGRVRWGGALLADLALAEVRERIVVAESTPHLFTGALANELDVRDRASESDLLRALAVADAADVLDSVPGGLEGEILEKGRSLSGGQCQRVALARALLTEAEILVLIEPTSAVDAHTEARIAQRLADARRGRTTVVVTASPLVLDAVDEVVLVEDGRVRVVGQHRALIEQKDDDARAYRGVVSRAVSDHEEDRHVAARR